MAQYQISIVGIGYVGLCTAVGFASKGYKVIASNHDPEKVALINKGIPPFHEPHLQESLQKVVKDGYLRCLLDREEAILGADITFIAVGTPSMLDGSIDLRYVKAAAQEIAEFLKKKKTYHLVVVKSTVVPGTTENVVKPIIENHSGKHCGIDLGLCVNPEFLREGSALHDTINPERIIIGEHDKKSGGVLETFFREFCGEEMPPLIRTTLPTAELIKYANNAFLATKISFINTIANMCQEISGVDITTVAKAIGLDNRIGPLFLNAGLGYGGSCLPKDVKALVGFSESLNYDAPLLKAVEQVNNSQPQQAVELARKHVGSLQNKRIAVLGLAFKPNTDDMREARSIVIINHLLNEGAKIIAYDPVAIPNAKSILGDKITYASSAIQCLKDADCCIIVTEWDEFKILLPENFVKNMRRPILIDGRRIYDPRQFTQKLIFAAVGLGQ